MWAESTRFLVLKPAFVVSRYVAGGEGLGRNLGFLGRLARATQGRLNSAMPMPWDFWGVSPTEKLILFNPAGLPDGLAARRRGMRFAKRTATVAELCWVIWLIVQ
jgi:hypothetical protein